MMTYFSCSIKDIKQETLAQTAKGKPPLSSRSTSGFISYTLLSLTEQLILLLLYKGRSIVSSSVWHQMDNYNIQDVGREPVGLFN